MKSIAWFGTGSLDGGDHIGHTLYGSRLRASGRVPLGRWLWLHVSGRGFINMRLDEQGQAAREYADRSGAPVGVETAKGGVA